MITETNSAAVKYLADSGWNGFNPAKEVVSMLVKGGFIEADPKIESEPEVFAQKAKAWLKEHGVTEPTAVFDKASGWNTESWGVVLSEENITHNYKKIKSIFEALMILAKEAGVI